MTETELDFSIATSPEERRKFVNKLEAVSNEDFEEYLHADGWKTCSRCRNCETRIGDPVIGKGPTVGAEIMFVGEAPGNDEERLGRPFVGESGELLHDILYMLGIDDADDRFRFTNVIMCRPADFSNPRRNRKPAPDEIKACFPRLMEEIRVTDPLLIVSLGAVALQTLGGKSCTLSKYLGEVTEITVPGKIRDRIVYPLLATWHPAKVLYETDPDVGIPVIDKLTDLFVYDSHYHNLARDILSADVLANVLRMQRRGEALPDDLKEALNAFRFSDMPTKWVPKIEMRD